MSRRKNTSNQLQIPTLVRKHWYVRRNFHGIHEVMCVFCKEYWLDDNKTHKRVKCPNCGARGYEDGIKRRAK